MNRLIEKTVFCGLVTAWRLAGVPTSRWPSLANATTDGVVRPPSALGMTVGSPPSITAMHELVVPRSMPITLLIHHSLSCIAVENLSRVISRFGEARKPCANRYPAGMGDVRDTMNRPLRDLRISVTDRCDFRCVY